jgi:hypothetical protein
MSTVGNGTTDAFDTGLASGYKLKLSHLLVMFFLFLYRLSANVSNPYDTIMLLIFTHNIIYFMIFEIKICHKMSLTPTAIFAPSWTLGNESESARDRQTRLGWNPTASTYLARRFRLHATPTSAQG